MVNYQTSVINARNAVYDFIQTVYEPFQAWTDLQKLILICGLVVFLGYLMARPPFQSKSVYDFSIGGKLVTGAYMLFAGAFCVGLVSTTTGA